MKRKAYFCAHQSWCSSSEALSEDTAEARAIFTRLIPRELRPRSRRVRPLSEYDALAARHINWRRGWFWRRASARDARRTNACEERTRKGREGAVREAEESSPAMWCGLFPCLLSTDTAPPNGPPEAQAVSFLLLLIDPHRVASHGPGPRGLTDAPVHARCPSNLFPDASWCP